MSIATVDRSAREFSRCAAIAAVAACIAGASFAQPLYLYGVDGDDDFMVRLDVNAMPPTIEFLGDVVNGANGNPVIEMEAMTWDNGLGWLYVASNAGAGPLFRIVPGDITAPPPADIPATFVGNTGTIQMEGLALEPAENTLYAVDNTTDPSRLVKVNKFTGAITQIVGGLEDANGNDYKNVEGLAFTASAPHVLYGANNPGEGLGTLLRIDKTTGAVTPIGSGIGFVNIECLVFAPNGTLYGFSNGNALEDQFITIDPVTGVGTLFNTVNAGGLDIEGCAFLEPPVNVGVEGATWSTVKSRYRTP